MIPVVIALLLLAVILRPKAASAAVADESEESMTDTTSDIGYVNGQPVTLSLASIGNGYRLRVDAAAAYLRMLDAARLADVDIPVDSAFRTQAQQAALVKRLGAYGVNGGVAAPVGKSPHQAGIAIDVLGLNPSQMNYNPARDAWLMEHAEEFGWHRTGLYFTTVEPWHLEYKP